MTSPATVYCVFEAIGDGDGYPHWNLCFVANSLERAQEILAKPAWKRIDISPAHSSMTAENRYTFIGTRDECFEGYDLEAHTSSDDIAGFVIEAQALQ